MVCESTQVRQKVRTHEAMDKLLDCFINMLMGGRGLVEINTRLRTDEGLQRAFGRTSCAEQSTVSDSLDACRACDVESMRAGLNRVLQAHGQVMKRNAKAWLVLDVDTTGLTAGHQCEGATKGFFSGKRDRRGRQLGRVLASDYDEMIVSRLYTGRRQLETSLMELVKAAETSLGLNAEMAENTVFRVDAGGGADANINALLECGYHILTKVHSWQRAEKLARSVSDWHTDPRTPQRAVGWVLLPHTYVRPTRQLAIRTTAANGKHKHRVLVTSLSDQQLTVCFKLDLPLNTPWLFLHAYDLRGGGIETQHRCDFQGLGLGHRTKRRFHAQEMLVLLAQLAHNFLIWMRNELACTDSRLLAYGLKRIVRDVLAIDGHIHFDHHASLSHVTLNPAHPLAQLVLATWPSHPR